MNTPMFSRWLLAAMLAMAGCTTQPPTHVMQDPQARFDTFKTFAWDVGQGQEPGQAASEPLSIVNSQIRGAITSITTHADTDAKRVRLDLLGRCGFVSKNEVGFCAGL